MTEIIKNIFVQDKTNIKKYFIVASASIIFLIIIGLILFNLNQRNSKTNVINQFQAPTPSPTPFLFQEMTIPYLRNRKYQSSIGELSQISTNSEYISYLTNYDSDGFNVNGLLTIPSGKKPTDGWPALVFVHGYIPPQNYQTLKNYSTYVDYLAKSGFVVFKIDLRGHGTSEGEAAGGYYSSDYIIDVLNARAALQNSDLIHPNKIGLWGHSMAGNVISRALAVEPNIPAISIWAGAVYTYTDFLEYGISDNSYQRAPNKTHSRRKRDELFKKYGQFNPNSFFWKQVPMTHYLTDIKGAIQLNHVIDDQVVDIRYSQNLNDLLDKTLIPHEFYTYQSGGHNFTGTTFNLAMQNTVDFFDKYVK